MARTKPRRLLLIAAAGPPLVLAVLRLLMLVASVGGAHPFWRWEPLTLSEAAALHDGGEVARLIADGHDPNGAYPVRPGILTSEPMVLTPIAAAMAARRGEIVDLLMDAGAKLPPPAP
jgi:hypothetical protein